MEKDKQFVGKMAKPVPKSEENIGIDTKQEFASELLVGAEKQEIDISELMNFQTFAQSREALYQLIDIMGEDTLINSILESYAEDATQRNSEGRVVWIESDNADVQKYGQYLLDVLQIDKNAFSHIYSLIKYGDLYLKLFRESDFDKDDIFDSEEADKKQALTESKYAGKDLKENVIVNIYSKQDHFANYVEDVPNPGEMSEIVYKGKTRGFMQAPYNAYTVNTTNAGYPNSIDLNTWTYDVVKDDVYVYPATEFVHAYLNDCSSRTPEEIHIYKDNKDKETGKPTRAYNIRRGKSILFDWFKSWREMSLLENAIILNRLTKSSKTQVVQVEVGDMPKEQVIPHMQGIKQLFEQKTSLDSGNTMGEYTNPGPITNIVYVPTHEGKGTISVGDVGGEYDPKQLTDVEYFRDKFFSGVGAPKQFFGFTEDGAGFNGGQSLSIISAKYGKRVNRIQTAYIYAITDLLNILFLDRGLNSYINNFKIKMVEPVTQADIDKKEAQTNALSVLRDIMGIIDIIEDRDTKLKILASLIKGVTDDTNVINYIQEYIKKLEEESPEEQEEENKDNAPSEEPDFGGGGGISRIEREPQDQDMDFNEPMENEPSENPTEIGGGEEPMDLGGEEDNYLPSGNELGIDLT